MTQPPARLGFLIGVVMLGSVLMLSAEAFAAWHRRAGGQGRER
jgi:hypothetical protein